MKMKTHEKFLEEMIDKIGYGYETLSKYNGANNRITIKHIKCGYIWNTVPSVILRGTICPKCSNSIKNKSTDYFKEEVFNLVSNEYEVLGNYKNSESHIKIRHNICGNEYNVKPNNFLNGKRCPKCRGGIKKSHEEFVEEMEDKYSNEYTILGKYTNARAKIKVRHNICGYEYEVTPDNLLSNGGCSNCSGLRRINTDEFKEMVYEIVSDEYEVVGEYINSTTKIKIKHLLCGYEYDAIPYTFLKGSRCLVCNESRGERAIRECLSKNNIKFISQYTFDDLLSDKGNPLKFDFAILNNVNELMALIEYDGIFHFKTVYDEHTFETTHQRDISKNKYCINNGIKLIRIPYWEFNITTDIIEFFLYQFKMLKVSSVFSGNIGEFLVDSKWKHNHYMELALDKKSHEYYYR